MKKIITGVLGAACIVCSYGHAQATDPAEQCEVAKLREAGRLAFCQLKAEARGVITNADADDANCVRQFEDRFAKINAKHEGYCKYNNDSGAVKTHVTAATLPQPRLA